MSLEYLKAQVPLEDILMLRRHEKDFIIRKDRKYADRLRERVSVVKEHIYQEGNASPAQAAQMVKTLNGYYSNFSKIVASETRMGLTPKDGLRGQALANASTLATAISRFSSMFVVEAGKTTQNFLMVFALVFTIIVVSAVLVSLYIISVISKPVNYMTEAIDAVEKGETNIDTYLEKIKSQDEIGRMSKSFGRMYEKLNDMITQEHEQSQNLRQLLKENEQRSWQNDGIAKLSAVLRHHNEDLQTTLDEYLKVLIKYVGLNQAALFITEYDNDNTKLELISCYAYGKAKQMNRFIYPGDGLVGQCYLEKEEIYLSEVPQGYVKITSGLGESRATVLYLVPAIFDNKVLAVIEIASFDKIESHKRDFIRQAAAVLATTLSTMQNNVRTRRLLAETQAMAESMKQQEEELRQNLEEMHAIQEDLERQQNDHRQQQTTMESIIDNSEDVVLALDRNFTVTALNKASKKRFAKMNINLETGIPFLAVIKSENREKCRRLYEKALAGEKFVTVENFNENGKYVTLQVHYSPVYDDAKRITGLSIISKEISLNRPEPTGVFGQLQNKANLEKV